MGRELRRVPMDFDWPLNKTWKGYINPHRPRKCPECGDGIGLGYSPLAKLLLLQWYGYHDEKWVWVDEEKTRRYNANAWSQNLTQEEAEILAKSDLLWDFTRVPINEEQREIVRKQKEEGGNSWLKFNNGYIPTPDELAEYDRTGFGLNPLCAHVLIKKKCKERGIEVECQECKGKGEIFDSKEHKEKNDAWDRKDPPEGEGFQLWETTSEGSPQSPVFESAEALAEWCAENATTFADYKTTKEQWMEMFGEDFIRHEEGNCVFI